MSHSTEVDSSQSASNHQHAHSQKNRARAFRTTYNRSMFQETRRNFKDPDNFLWAHSYKKIHRAHYFPSYDYFF